MSQQDTLATGDSTGDPAKGKPASPEVRRSNAIVWCDKGITWYNRTSTYQRILSMLSVAFAILMGGVTPILILVGEPSIPRWLQATPAALATMATATATSFHWRENAIRYAYTRERLKNELFRYQTLTPANYTSGDNDEENALTRFVTQVDMITTEELTAWRTETLTDTANAQKKGADGGHTG